MGVTDDRDELAPSEARQHELADGCDTTIVTEAASAVFADGGARLREASDRAFRCRPVRYDLLSAPCLKLLMSRSEWIDLLARDIRMTVGLHRVEKVLVAPLTAPHQTVIQQLKQRREAVGRLAMKGTTVTLTGRTHEAPIMALTCMDWRLHGPGGFGSFFSKAYDTGKFSVFATAGAAKDLAHDGIRSQMAFAQISHVAGKLDTLVLIAHTDCGGYGGSRAFPDLDTELRTLGADLAAAKDRISAAFPRLTVMTAIARTRGNRCLGVTPFGV